MKIWFNIIGGHGIGINIHDCRPNLEMTMHVLKSSLVHATVSDSGDYLVELEAITKISDGQKWHRGTADINGWFLLTNPHSGKVLTENCWNQGYYTCIRGN